jgi:hypothetical protein
LPYEGNKADRREPFLHKATPEADAGTLEDKCHSFQRDLTAIESERYTYAVI